MALRWEIDRQQQLVTVVAEGRISRTEVDALLDDILAAETRPLAKLVDCSLAVPSMPLEDLLAIGMRIRDQPGPAGPLAFLQPQHTEGVGRLLGILATLPRPMRIFRRRSAAARWLRAAGARTAVGSPQSRGMLPG
ncbi:MAG: hypothetical protein ACOY4R_29815 [Pseudomonadota bacterium]